MISSKSLEQIITDLRNAIANTENVLKPDLECSSCKELYSDYLKLKAALTKYTQLVTADNISSSCSLSTNCSCTSSPEKLQSDDDTTYHIPKGKHDLLIVAMKDSREFCSVKFDRNGILVHAEPDISREMNND
jgi:hypothetical protein